VPETGAAGAGSALDQVVAAERGFARASTERGIQAAFLAHMADDGVVFRERVTSAKLYYATNPSPGHLTWAPAWGGASAAGDLGFTTGPFTFRRTADDTLVAHGQYASVWARQPDGGWKVLADIGAPGPASVGEPAFVARALGGPAPAALAGMRAGGSGAGARGGPSAAAIVEGMRATLLVAERGFAAVGAAEGPAGALPGFAAADVRALWPGVAPVVGRDSVRAVLERRAAERPGLAWRWQTTEARVARSGDLGVTWGGYEARRADGAIAEMGTYLRLWGREDGGWRVLLDAINPQPGR
jgi:ketosteroid isomerase-like protein